MGLEAEQFTNINNTFTNVRFNVTDGYQRINTVDAVITSAPHAKSKLVYNCSDQELIVAGAATGGTLYYAIGDNDKTAPSDSEFKTAVPVAKNVCNYYIWYKVEADSNHVSISPAYLKNTMADEKWVTVNGVIKNNDGKTPTGGAKVTLMKGNTVVDEITADANGAYYFTVPAQPGIKAFVTRI